MSILLTLAAMTFLSVGLVPVSFHLGRALRMTLLVVWRLLLVVVVSIRIAMRMVRITFILLKWFYGAVSFTVHVVMVLLKLACRALSVGGMAAVQMLWKWFNGAVSFTVRIVMVLLKLACQALSVRGMAVVQMLLKGFQYERGESCCQDHPDVMHPEDSVWKCSTCERVFHYYVAYASHMKAHARRENSCGVCGKVCKTKFTLSRHMVVHNR